MVNHKRNFVNPEVLRNVPYKGPRGERRVVRRVLIHTQNVERFNGLLKSYTGEYRGIRAEVLKQYCMRHIFMYRIVES